MITAEELEKLAQLKEKGIITEDEFNAKKSEYLNNFDVDIEQLNQDTDCDDESSSTWIWWLIFLVIGLSLVYCSQISYKENNGICGRYDRSAGGALWIGKNSDYIQFNFPTQKVAEEWDKYDNHNICISGDIHADQFHQGVYYVRNPRFVGYQ